MVHVGARLRCLPGEQEFRVRSIQVHGESVVEAGQGQRVALNLAGADRAAIERGQVICDERLTRATDRFDALLEVTTAARNGLKNHQRVRVHLGTAERMGRLILLTADVAAPRTSVFCQVVLYEPLFAARGDRFVIRDETARRTVAGGRVIHPWAHAHKRRDPALAASLATYASADLEAIAASFIEQSESFAVSLEQLSEFLDIQQGDARAVADHSARLMSIEIEGSVFYTTVRKWKQLRDHALAEIAAFHAAHPLAPGREMEDLRMRVAPALTARTFRTLLERLEQDGTLAREGSLVRLPSHTVSLNDEEQRVASSITNLLGAAPLTPPNLAEIERELGLTRAALTDIIRMLERSQSIVRVGSDVYFLKSTLDEIEQAVTQECEKRGDLTPAAFRDRFGTSRKYTIPLLEYFDRIGVTIRIGDVRKLKRRAG
jgi:selenocysteine-specific elongation factor